jgi:hypothetical protein
MEIGIKTNSTIFRDPICDLIIAERYTDMVMKELAKLDAINHSAFDAEIIISRAREGQNSLERNHPDSLKRNSLLA